MRIKQNVSIIQKLKSMELMRKRTIVWITIVQIIQDVRIREDQIIRDTL